MSNPADLFPEDIVARVTRPDGTVKWLRIPGEHLQRVMDLANGEFGDASIDLGGPALPRQKGT